MTQRVHSSHNTRISDASSFDEICENCGAHDTLFSLGDLVKPCPKPKMKDVIINDGYTIIVERRKTMDMDTYQSLAMRTLSGDSKNDPLLTCALGLAGESGEVAEHVKKVRFHGHQFDRVKFEKELGDVMWYIACGCYALNLDMGEVARRNIEKLRARYPDGFQTALSINKDETKE